MTALAQAEAQALQPAAIAVPTVGTTPTLPAAPALPVLAGPLGAALQALKAGMTVADMRAMLDIQKEWEANEARKAYVADMAAFKLNPPEIFKTKHVSFSDTSYMHATIGDVNEKIVAALAQHGFSHRWETNQDGGTVIVTCTLTHRLGHSESNTLKAGADNSGKKNAIQAVCSTVTYLERYTLLAACGMATKDLPDDDGAGYGQNPPAYDAEATLAAWAKVVEGAKTIERLNEVRKQAGRVFAEAQDVVSWNSVKVLVEQRRNAIKPADAEEGAAA